MLRSRQIYPTLKLAHGHALAFVSLQFKHESFLSLYLYFCFRALVNYRLSLNNNNNNNNINNNNNNNNNDNGNYTFLLIRDLPNKPDEDWYWPVEIL